MEIFLDENLSEYVADALNSLNRGYFDGVRVVSTKMVDGLGRGATDDKIIPYVGLRRGALVSRDKDMSRGQLRFGLCQEHGVIVISVKFPQGSDNHWGQVKLLVNNWNEIMKIMTSHSPRSIRVTSEGIKDLRVE